MRPSPWQGLLAGALALLLVAHDGGSGGGSRFEGLRAAGRAEWAAWVEDGGFLKTSAAGPWRRRLECTWVQWKHERVCDDKGGASLARKMGSPAKDHPRGAGHSQPPMEGDARASEGHRHHHPRGSGGGGGGSDGAQGAARLSDGPVFSGVGRIAVCMTGQVRSLEEVNGNIRDMVVRPLQALVDLPPFADQQPANASSPLPRARRGLMAAADEGVGRAAPASRAGAAALRVMSNVHLYATLALQDTLEGKGFDCAKSVHPRPQVA